jgi:hypothetical protein
MISLEDRQKIAAMIEQARREGARLKAACEVGGIDARTLQRWETNAGLRDGDARPRASRPVPAHALSLEEREQILRIANEPRFAALPPARIVPALADEGVYIASESSFSRVLRAHGQTRHRGRAKAPRRVRPPTTHIATGPRQVWTWDMTFLPTQVPRNRHCRYPITDLMMPNTGSGVCLRSAYSFLPRPRRLQPIRHLLQRGCRVGRGFRSGSKALFPAHMMARASHRDQWFDLGRHTLLDVALAQIPIVGKDSFSATDLFGQRLQLLEHRQELPFVVGGLCDLGGNDEHAARSDHCLGVVTLIEAPTGDLHDARVFIRQVYLVQIRDGAGLQEAHSLFGEPALERPDERIVLIEDRSLDARQRFDACEFLHEPMQVTLELHSTVPRLESKCGSPHVPELAMKESR